MCNFNTLSNIEFGLVVWCQDCESYNLYFGNIVLTLNHQGLEQFKDYIMQKYSASYCNGNRECKQILVETTLDGMQMFFSLNEMGALIALIQEAEINHFQDLLV